MARSISQGVWSQEVRRHCEAKALIPKGVGASFLFYTGLSTGQGTCTRLPHETQVASRKYQTSSKSSKQAITLNTSQPHEQTWTGPRLRRSVPNFGGRLSLFFSRESRRNHTVCFGWRTSASAEGALLLLRAPIRYSLRSYCSNSGRVYQ